MRIAKLDIFNYQDVKDVVAGIRRYRNRLDKKVVELSERLAKEGLKMAKFTFDSANYDYLVGHGGEEGFAPKPEITVSVHRIDSVKSRATFALEANGEKVAFVEFGAGVFFNPGGGIHPGRPDGIVGIGEYGQGKGKRQAWGYYDEAGIFHVTRGTPEQPGMLFASLVMRSKLENIAREVFSHD